MDIDCIILVVNSVSAMLNHDRKLRKLSATKVWDGKTQALLATMRISVHLVLMLRVPEPQKLQWYSCNEIVF